MRERPAVVPKKLQIFTIASLVSVVPQPKTT